MKLTFFGAGNMAEALLKGIMSKNGTQLDSICLCDINEQRLQYLKSEYPEVEIQSSNIKGMEKSDILILSVKPQQMQSLLIELSGEYKNQLIISIAAGISIGLIQKYMGDSSEIIRVMPNTPALIGRGISVMSSSKSVQASQCFLARDFLGCVGQVIEMEEKKMDAVTALSGSGPAYFFKFLEILIESGESLGLSPEEAKKLSLFTGLGAIELAIQSQESIGNLREKVTSKGGTTEAALNSLEESEFSEIIKEAIENAFKKSKEIGESMK